MTSPYTRSAAIRLPVALLAIAGLAMGGCEAFELGQGYTYAVPISYENANGASPTTTPAPVHSGNVPYDPFQAAGGAINTKASASNEFSPTSAWVHHGGTHDDVIRLNPVIPPKAQASNVATNLYGEFMASAADGRASGFSSRGGGGNYSQLSFAAEGADFDPCVTPDGEHVVFASTQHQPTADLYIKTFGGRVVTQLTTDHANDVMPRISPDGQRIAFASDRNGNWDIFVMPITGGRAIQVTSSPSDELGPSWSPDGQQLVYSRLGEVSSQWELWVAGVFSAGSSKFIGFGLFPQWCPIPGTGADGADRIAFQRSRERGDRYFGLWAVDYKDGQAGNATEFVSIPGVACINPAWSPDGRWLVFATVANAGDWARQTTSRPSSSDLWLMDVNADTRIRLTSADALNLMPTWTPSNTLVFVSDRSGVDNIWSMNLHGAIQLASGGKAHTPVQGSYTSGPKDSKPATTALKASPTKPPAPDPELVNADGAGDH
jgi:TolB protein